MSIGARRFLSARTIARKCAATPVLHKATHSPKLPSNQQLLRHAHAASPTIQPKLRLSQETDPAEVQADAVADQIVARGYAPGRINAVTHQMNRACAKCEEELDRQVDPDEQAVAEVVPIADDVEEDEDDDYEEDETGMPKRDTSRTASVSETVIPNGSGVPLSGEVLSRMENGFRASFDQVRVHSSPESARATSRVGALAFTVGNNVYFGAGQYAPGTQSGTRLLAHELTHVLQQKAGQGSISRKSKKTKGCAPKSGGANVCSAGNCPQGKQPKAVTGDCGTSGPADENRFIKHLEVSISGHKVVATWSDGSTNTWPCSPNPSCTPKGPDKVGDKCTIKHTNEITKARKRPDGMAWFTGFEKQWHRIGFHDSQPVGKGFESHGCVRVCCDVAELINKNTWSRNTTINVS